VKRIVQTADITIYQGEAAHWSGLETVDLVLTNPYGFLPLGLASYPMVIHQWVHRRQEAEIWCYNELRHCVGMWNDSREAFWSAHLPEITVDVCGFRPEPGGWYPEDMVRRLLMAYATEGQTIWDGFMGRGTVAKIARELGLKYIGVERLSAHIEIAREYLGV
jgi:hypothetical protein